MTVLYYIQSRRDIEISNHGGKDAIAVYTGFKALVCDRAAREKIVKIIFEEMDYIVY